LLGALALLVPSIWLATKLGLSTDLKDLLPQKRRSVTELERISSRIGGNASFTIGIEGDDVPAMKRFADDVAARLRALPPGLIDHVDESPRAERDFFLHNRWLFADLADLQKISDALDDRVIAETPFGLGLDDPPAAAAGAPAAAGSAARAAAPGPPPRNDLKSIHDKLEAKRRELDRFPEGYYLGEGGHLLAVYAYVPGGTDFDQARRLLERVRGEIAAMQPTRYHPSLRATVTGDLYVGIREYDALRQDIFLASGLCVSLVLLVIVVFYGRLRSLAVIGISLVVGVGITFGFARLTIGYLNSSTAFLGSIVAGNGINFCIVMLARFFEERRRGRGADEAVDIAVRRTAAGTGGAAVAAGIAYGSLMITDFRGFNQFGVIGGFGMVVCWIAAYTVGPALIVLCERVPFLARRSGRRWWDLYSLPFALAVRKLPRTLVVAAALLSAAGVVIATRFIISDPIEYNFSNLMDKERKLDYAAGLARRIGGNIRTEGRDGVVILADRPDQVRLIREALEAKRRAGGPSSPVGGAFTVEDLLPADQPEKLAVLAHIRSVIDKVKGNLDDEERRIAEDERPLADLRPLGVRDLPASVRAPFTERDGTVGRVVYVTPARWVEPWRGGDLLKFSTAVERLELQNGETIYTSGTPVVFADMLRSVLTDGPRAVAASLVGVLVLIFVMMRGARATVLTLVTVLCGIAVQLGVAALAHMKLNFLNFVAIPITIGVGADYAVNMVRRYLDEPDMAPHEIVRTTGGAVTLCSMTTIIGYGALLVAANRALISFGLLAMIGEVTCLITAVMFFPALVRLLGRPATRSEAGVVAGPPSAGLGDAPAVTAASEQKPPEERRVSPLI
jgi:predicted RND superfamily exporter protein